MSSIKDLQLSRNTVTKRFERMETLQLCWRERLVAGNAIYFNLMSQQALRLW